MNDLQAVPAPAGTVREPGTWGALFRFELTKMMGRRITWVPFLITGIVVALIVTVYHHAEFGHLRANFEKMKFFFNNKAEFINGYFLASYNMVPIFHMLVPIFITVASGIMMAGESEQGTLRACLIRPVSRARLILVKFFVLYAYSLTIALFAVALLASAGILNFSTGTLYAMNMFFGNGQEGISTIPASEVPARIAVAWLLVSSGMAVLSALALLISSLVESAAMAYVLSLSIYFAFMTLRALPFLDWMHPYLFVTHMHCWQQCFFSYFRTGDIMVSLVHQAAYLVAFLSAAVLLFKERDIKS